MGAKERMDGDKNHRADCDQIPPPALGDQAGGQNGDQATQGNWLAGVPEGAYRFEAFGGIAVPRPHGRRAGARVSACDEA